MTDGREIEFNDGLKGKIYGCLAGVAVGDAFGMPAANLPPNEIRRRYGTIKTFLDAPPDHPIHSGLKQGTVTDDTELTMIVVKMILDDGKVTRQGIARRLLKWVTDKRLLETRLLGPSTIRAVQELMAGKDPSETGRHGTTNGSAMKIAPIGIINFGKPIRKIVDDVEELCMPTHWTSVAISAAAAVAAAVAEALNPSPTITSVLKAAKIGARIGEKRGVKLAYPSIEKRIELAVKLVKAKRGPMNAARTLYSYIGADVSCLDSVPTAFGLFVASKGDPMTTIKSTANMGGDADTIASIAGGIAGAFKGIEAFPLQLVKKVDEVNHLELAGTAEKLLHYIGEHR